MRHLYEGRTWAGTLYARALCGGHQRAVDPVRLTRAQDLTQPPCPRCLAVQQRRLTRRRKRAHD